MYARYALSLGNESPLQTWQQELLTEGKSVHREVEAKESRIEK